MADSASVRVPAITRAAAALRLLGGSAVPLGVQAIARELELAPSTSLYILRALVAEQLVSFDPETKRYALDAGVLTLARQWLMRSRFADLAQPILDRLSARFGLTMLGVERSGRDHMIVVGLAQGGQGFQLSAQIGSRFPLLISATGRSFAAFGDYPPAELERRFRTLRWDDPPTFDEWLAEIEQARTNGFAVDEGRYISGVTIVSAPVWKGDGKPSHALVATGIGAAVQRIGLKPLTEAVVDASQSLSQQLSGRGGH